MKAYKIELVVIDIDDLGADDLIHEIESHSMNNGYVTMVTKLDKTENSEEWDDSNILNQNSCSAEQALAEFERIKNSS